MNGAEFGKCDICGKDKNIRRTYYAYCGGCINHAVSPNLGLATTRQLLLEITARIEVDGNLDYRTVAQGNN